MRKHAHVSENQRFGRLVTAYLSHRNKRGEAMWECICDCGKHKTVRQSDLTSGHTQSCGCLSAEKVSNRDRIRDTTHGLSNTRIFQIWCAMNGRCKYKHLLNYKNYGGRGISACPEWRHDFMAFYEWAMTHGYADDLTIDRIDVDGNYEPSNCRWADLNTQSNNKRISHYIAYKGKRLTVKQWSNELAISYGRLNYLSRKYHDDMETILRYA